jgi:hypothetical protein
MEKLKSGVQAPLFLQIAQAISKMDLTFVEFYISKIMSKR